MSYFQDPGYIRELYADENHIRARGDFLKTYSNRRYSIRDIARRFLHKPSQKRILDIGAGTGSFLRQIMQSHPDNIYAALEIVDNPLCRNTPGLTYRLFDGVHFPNDLGTWDIITMMHMLYHVPDLDTYLTDVRHVLRDNGIILITTKSRLTLPAIEAIFQRIMAQHAPDVAIPPYKDESHFCSENGLAVLRRTFTTDHYAIEDYAIESQLLVEEPEAVVRYALSTPRYQPNTYNLPISPATYRKLWLDAVQSKQMFTDTVKEVLYVISHQPGV